MNTSANRFASLIATWLLAALCAAPLLADGPGELKFDEDSFPVLEEAGTVTIVVERSRGEFSKLADILQ